MTVLAAILIAVLLTVAGGGIALGSVVVARHRAQTAADLAALAAAARVPAGSHAACQQAQAIVSAMRAMMGACRITELDVTVTVSVRTGLRIGGRAEATARAGPIARG